MRRLLSSPSRAQALIEFEPTLLDVFEKLAPSPDAEIRDIIHYALFSESDRFCISSAWLVAPRLGVTVDRFKVTACAIEMLRCSLSLKERPAVSALIPLAFQAVLAVDGGLTSTERADIATILARSGSPLQTLTALHLEQRALREGNRPSISRSELLHLHVLKVGSAFPTVGNTLEYLSPKKDIKAGALADWFTKLGLFAYWVQDFEAQSNSPFSLNRLMSFPEAMDLIKSQEAELFEMAKELGIRAAAHEIMEPLADMLKTQLQ